MKIDYYKIVRAVEMAMLLGGIVFFGAFITTLMIEAIGRNMP
tara:strand:+ start:1263 stop:1388 length:126 start_codon:yes stop_codon:yes gene_type:complete